MGATFTDSQKNQIRRWLGYSRIYVQLYPKLENAMIAVQAISDGGSQPDDSAVLLIQGWLTNLNTLETQELSYVTQAQVFEAGTDNVKIDVSHGIYNLRKIMKRYIGHISDTLSTKPFRDVFLPVEQTQETLAQQQADRVFSDYGQ